jgi:hypothetical protein
MRKPKRPALNRTRERRIEQEIVVDAYTQEERAIRWNYYLEEKLRFPFKARCVSLWAISPFKKGMSRLLRWQRRTTARARCLC